MPFYERLGFRPVSTAELSPALRARVEAETRRGLDPSRRVVMRRPCDCEATGQATDTLTPLDPTPDEVQYLEDRIYEFNSRVTGITDGEWLAFVVRERDRVVAGICGNTWGGTCELRQLWVEESRRGRGLGTKLLQAAEQEARRRGCTQIVLMTFSFQAPAFYRKNGFDLVAAVDAHPRGHHNFLMRKRLTATLLDSLGD
jgi:N-acetylglutamate synthase-like GNAT family acetyltransferase